MNVLVAGATGSIGGQVTAELLASGATVRALVRSAESAALLPSGVEPVRGDLRDADSVAAALAGAETALYVSPHSTQEVQLAETFVSTCERLDVRLVFAGVAMTMRNPLLRWTMQLLVNTALRHYRGKLRIARRIATSNARPVVFGVANYFQNDELIRDEILGGAYYLPAHGSGVNRIDLRDVAEVVARAMTDPAFPTGVYGLVGPESISGVQAARVWSEALDRPVRYEGDGPHWPSVLARHLTGAKLADYRRTLAFLARHGVPTSARDVTATAALLGHAPRSYEAYVRATAQRWASDTVGVPHGKR